MHSDDIPVPQQVWEDAGSSSRSVSEGSLNVTSSEQLALSGFAFQLTSIIGSDDGSIADEVDVQEEAKLLMRLSCSTPETNNYSNFNTTNATTCYSTNNNDLTGRITPSSDSSSCHSSTSSKRDSFCFTCPSLSLENHSSSAAANAATTNLPHQQHTEEHSSASSSSSSLPSVLLGRALKIDDKDALRLSSEAMGRNILQSYKKALDWRLKSWEHSLSRVLVDKERECSSEQEAKQLLTCPESNLLLTLKAMETKLRVMDATTSFKVLPQRLENESEPPSKKASSLEETEYEYQVTHAMMLEGSLNIFTPAGYCKIELQVPGSMTGTFLDTEQLTSVCINVNTDILAAMIEKSCRQVIRAAAEALLKGEEEQEQEVAGEEEQAVETSPTEEEEEEQEEQEEEKEQVEETAPVTATTTSTPKRKFSEEPMSMVITPARNVASSPSSFGDSDYEDHKPVLLSLPDSFSGETKALRMLTPSNKKARILPTVVTPHKTHKEAITSGSGPILPLLVEVACAMVKK